MDISTLKKEAPWRPQEALELRKVAAVALVAAAALALLYAPNVLSLYWVRVLANIFLFAIVAQGINLIAGYTGYPAFGNVVFFGLGAYGTAVTMVRLGGSFPTGLLVGAVLCLAFTLAFGPPLLRLRGHYFAVATLGLNEATKAIANNWRDVTGGGNGLSVPLPPGSVAENAAFFYYLLFALMAFGVLVTYVLSTSRLGYACRAIRSDEVTAGCAGVNATLVKTVVWAISAVLTGLAGGIYAYWFSYIEPGAVFDMTIAVKSFVIFLIGGAGTLLGPIAGAFFVELITTLAWSHLLSWHLGVLGLIIIAVVVFMPDGFAAFLRDRGAAAPAPLRGRRR